MWRKKEIAWENVADHETYNLRFHKRRLQPAGINFKWKRVQGIYVMDAGFLRYSWPKI